MKADATDETAIADAVTLATSTYRLTAREEQVLEGVALGLTTKELAESMHLSIGTVRVFLRLVFTKLGVSTRADIVAKLIALGETAQKPESRRRSRPSPLNSTLELLIEKATQVTGSREAAMRWLGTPVRALDYATPISVLGTADGVMRVDDVLGQMEHGVW